MKEGYMGSYVWDYYKGRMGLGNGRGNNNVFIV